MQRTPQETLYKIKTQEVAYPAELSEGAADFIRAALVRNPEQRVSLVDLLQHPWVLKHKRSAAGPHMRGRTQTQVRRAVRQAVLPDSHDAALAGSAVLWQDADTGERGKAGCTVWRLRSCPGRQYSVTR